MKDSPNTPNKKHSACTLMHSLSLVRSPKRHPRATLWVSLHLGTCTGSSCSCSTPKEGARSHAPWASGSVCQLCLPPPGSGQHLTCSHLLLGLLLTCSPLISSDFSKFMAKAFAPDLAASPERPGLVLLSPLCIYSLRGYTS